MKISARIAVHSLPDRRVSENKVRLASNYRRQFLSVVHADFNSSNIVIRDLSQAGFAAETSDQFVKGSLVRVRIPAIGMVIARLVSVRKGRIEGEFVNRVGEARLNTIVRLLEPAPLVSAA